MAGLESKFARHAEMLGQGSRLALSGTQPTYTEIALEQITPDPDQPRKDLGDLSELAASIREIGVIQPIIVRIIGYEQYRILAGERRFSAAKLASLPRIPAIVRSVEEHERLALQLVENLHRKDLNPIEEARSYQRLVTEFGLSHEKLGEKLGKTQVSVTETLKILELPSFMLQEFQEDGDLKSRINKSLLIEIARRPFKEQTALWDAAKQGELTVRQVRATRRNKRTKKARSAASKTGSLFRYPITLFEQDASVTIEFAIARPRLDDIVRALEEALVIEKARIR